MIILVNVSQERGAAEQLLKDVKLEGQSSAAETDEADEAARAAQVAEKAAAIKAAAKKAAVKKPTRAQKLHELADDKQELCESSDEEPCASAASRALKASHKAPKVQYRNPAKMKAFFKARASGDVPKHLVEMFDKACDHPDGERSRRTTIVNDLFEKRDPPVKGKVRGTFAQTNRFSRRRGSNSFNDETNLELL